MRAMSCRTAILLLTLGLTQAAPALQDEIRFAEGLAEAGFPGLARIVLDRTLRDFPAAEKAAPELRIRILVAEEKFTEAQTQIAAVKNSAPLWLALAGAAQRVRRLSSAEEAYKKYFESGAKADDAFFQAAFNYGELLEQRGDTKSTRALYEKGLSLPMTGQSSRPVKVKLAKLLVEENPGRAKRLCEEVQLGGLDLWFGQAVTIWADMMIRQGAWSEAQSVLETQLELLKQIEGVLEKQGQPVSLISPLAGARYLLGICYEHADKKAEALVQFYNVYVQYGDSEYGPPAQEKAQMLKDCFERQGKTVQIDLGANRSKMEESALRVARRLFFDKQYVEAIPAYLVALNQYPEGGGAVTALRELTLSYISLNDPLRAKTIAACTGERFAAREEAADALLAAGKRALDEKQNALAWWMYDRYFECFPQHSRAPAVLYSLAELKTGVDRETCWNRIIENYPDSPYAARALSRLAWNAYEQENYSLAAGRFEKVLITETDFQKQTRARFALGESYRNLAQQNPGSVGDVAPPLRFESSGRASLSERAAHAWKRALESFQTLETSLNKTTEGGGACAELAEFIRPFVEKSTFYQGVCLAKLGETERAVQSFDRFIEKFQGSEIIPQARLAKGSALMELKRFDDALAAFAVFDGSSERKVLEPALYYRGQALFETARYDQSIQSLETMLNRWPESALYFEAKLVQGRAYAAAGENSDAVRVLSDILSFASDELLLNRANLELGRAQTDPAEKLASFQRVALLANPENSNLAPLIAEALFASLPLYLELNRPQDLLTDADRLTAAFPMFGKTEEINSLREQARQLQGKLTADNADQNG
jgi:tetratricopeptide (TPR) repeat protein